MYRLKTTSIYYILISIILVSSVLHSCFVMSYHLLTPSYHLHVHLSSVIMEFPTAPAGRVAWRASAPAPSAAVAALRTAAPSDVATCVPTRPNAWVWQILSPGHHIKITWKWQTAIGGARWRIWPKGALGLDSNGSNSCATCSLKLKKDVTWFLKCFKPFTLKAAFSRSLTQRRTGFSKGPPGRQLSLEILDVLGEILPCRLHKLRTTHGQTV